MFVKDQVILEKRDAAMKTTISWMIIVVPTDISRLHSRIILDIQLLKTSIMFAIFGMSL